MEDKNKDELAALIRTILLGGTSVLVASPYATPLLVLLLVYLASMSLNTLPGGIWKGAA